MKIPDRSEKRTPGEIFESDIQCAVFGNGHDSIALAPAFLPGLGNTAGIDHQDSVLRCIIRHMNVPVDRDISSQLLALSTSLFVPL